jgi:hypothetical protein
LIEDLSVGLADLFGFSKDKESPAALVDSPLPSAYTHGSGPETVLAYARTSTAKPGRKKKKPRVNVTKPEIDIGEFNVNVFDDTIPGMIDASESFFETVAGMQLRVANFSDCASLVMNAIEPVESDNTLGPNAAAYLKDIINEGVSRGVHIGLAAYALATAYHETQNFTRKEETPASVATHGKSTYDVGRGYVHLTHRGNYQVIGQRLGIDLITNPHLAGIDAAYAARILFEYLDYRKDLGDFKPELLAAHSPQYGIQRGAVNGDSSRSISRAKGQPKLPLVREFKVSQRQPKKHFGTVALSNKGYEKA